MEKTRAHTALDADGVLLDYNSAYALLWEKVFKVRLTLVRPDGYHAIQRYGLPFLEKEELEYFNSFKNEEFWSSIPALPGALEACALLNEFGHRLTCVTAISPKYLEARKYNLEKLGFVLDAVVATGTRMANEVSPKAEALARLSPDLHVDDFYRYFKGIPKHIRRILIHRDPYQSPNLAADAAFHVDDQFTCLYEFAKSLK